MEPSPSELARALEQLDRRVAAIEAALAAAGAAYPATTRVAGSASIAVHPDAPRGETLVAEAPPLLRPEWVTVPALIGRTCVALAGAYLLRALTDSGALAPAVGVAAGLAYAALWFYYADHAPISGRVSAAFHGLVGALVAFPLVWEAAIRFRLFTPAMTATVLGGVAAVGLIVAARRRLQIVAWIVALLAASAASALIPATDRIVPFAILLIALGVATLWLGYVRDWVALRWPIAAFADFAVVGLTIRVATGHGVEGPATALAIQVLLIGAFLFSIMIRTLVRGRDVIPFEIVQGILALTIGLGGAVAVARAATAGTIAVGAATLLLGASCYALAFMFVARRQGLRANFYFYTTLGVMLVLASTHLLLTNPALTITLAAFTMAAGFVAARTGPRFIVTHAAIYGIAAALASELLFVSTFRLAAPTTAEWPAFAWPMLLAVIAPAACEAMPLPRRSGTWDFWSHPPRLILLLLTMWGGAGWVIEIAARVLGNGSGPIGPGALATLRTAVLSIAALGLARLGRLDSFREARWVVYPLLFVGGVKLLMEDLPRSRPSTLFVAFAAYGVALIVAPRLYQPRASEPSDL